MILIIIEDYDKIKSEKIMLIIIWKQTKLIIERRDRNNYGSMK